MTLAAIMLAFVISAGCGSKPKLPGAHLAGTITIDGQPVEKGAITFMPTGSTRGKTAGAHIKDGLYDCPYVPLGEISVQINAVRATGRMVDVMGVQKEEMQDIILSKEDSAIKIEVREENLNQDFKLKSASKSK
jgi:hypothetical protein